MFRNNFLLFLILDKHVQRQSCSGQPPQTSPKGSSLKLIIDIRLLDEEIFILQYPVFFQSLHLSIMPLLCKESRWKSMGINLTSYRVTRGFLKRTVNRILKKNPLDVSGIFFFFNFAKYV